MTGPPALNASDMPARQRFQVNADIVTDRSSGLLWHRNASLAEFPLTWIEALDFVKGMNERCEQGFSDWRLPNRRELFSLLSHETVNPALPQRHPFRDVFNGYYWSSSTCARLPRQAWYAHLGGARLFKGMKHGSYMLWPVRGTAVRGGSVFRTGQRACYDEDGRVAPCAEGGQDGAVQGGTPWPAPRFSALECGVLDRLTRRVWSRSTDLCSGPVDWEGAKSRIEKMNTRGVGGCSDWRLPGIRELESLVDLQSHSPALPESHPFEDVAPYHWSVTTSAYDPDYAWVLYGQDGAVGVGFKTGADFHVWAVRNDTS